jgi:hypothetical protein
MHYPQNVNAVLDTRAFSGSSALALASTYAPTHHHLSPPKKPTVRTSVLHNPAPTRSLPSHRRPSHQPYPIVVQGSAFRASHNMSSRYAQTSPGNESRSPRDVNQTPDSAETTRATTSSAPTTAAPRPPNPSKSLAHPTAALVATGTLRPPLTPASPHTPARRIAALAICILAGVAMA